MDLSIVIVSWKTKNFIQKCLASIFREARNLKFEVFVIDNNSGDGTVEMVKNDFPQVKLIANTKNLGFAKACNQAMRQAIGDFVLLLNPDTEITNNALEKLVTFMMENPEAGVVGCKLLNPDNSHQLSVRRFPTFCSHFLMMLKIHNFLPEIKSIKNYYWLDFDYNKTQKVDQVMGAAFMIRTAVLKKVGFLDQKFFLWYEEIDFCKRIKKAGWQVYYFPDAQIKHQKGESFKQQLPLKKQVILNKSILHYFNKHKPKIEYLGLLILYPFSILLALIIQLFNIKKKRKEL